MDAIQEGHDVMGKTPDRPNKTPACPFCGSTMHLCQSNEHWLFLRCARDGYWTARDSHGDWPSFAYSDAPDFCHGAECEWATKVAETSPIMRHKFELAHMRKGTLLDIGCSEGNYVAGSAELGWTAAGVEIDEAKVSRARSRGLDVRRVSLPAEVDRLPRVDFVMLRHVLEHVPDFIEFARTAASIVAPGGVLWVECPNQAGLASIRTRRSVRDERYLGALYPPTHIHAFEPTAFRRLGEQIGLTCERIVTYASSDPRWCPPYQSQLTSFKETLHRIAAALGYGSDIAVVYRKSV